MYTCMHTEGCTYTVVTVKGKQAQGGRRGWDDVAQLGKVEGAVGMFVKASPKR